MFLAGFIIRHASPEIKLPLVILPSLAKPLPKSACPMPAGRLIFARLKKTGQPIIPRKTIYRLVDLPALPRPVERKRHRHGFPARRSPKPPGSRPHANFAKTSPISARSARAALVTMSSSFPQKSRTNSARRDCSRSFLWASGILASRYFLIADLKRKDLKSSLRLTPTRAANATSRPSNRFTAWKNCRKWFQCTASKWPSLPCPLPPRRKSPMLSSRRASPAF